MRCELRFFGKIFEFERFGFGRGDAISDFHVFLLHILERLARLMSFLATPVGGFFVLLRNMALAKLRIETER